MSYLLDTSVISELVKPSPDDNVVAWMKRADETSLYLSVLTIGELEKGIAKLPVSRTTSLLRPATLGISSAAAPRASIRGCKADV